MNKLLRQLAICIERGKVDEASPYPPDLKGKEGAGELTKKALDLGMPPGEVLADGLIKGMNMVGIKFKNGEYYLPDVLMAARAMYAGMAHLKPHFQSGKASYKGSVVLGTVAGDLHDIGKKIVSMFFAGSGWKVIDLGVDVAADKFVRAIEKHKPNAVGLSALLTTTMQSMADITSEIKGKHPNVLVIVGGAPLTKEFAKKIGADTYSPDPQGALDYLHLLTA
jgi:5-methyltetrahydrofolate--homocysteine methyltransferase